MRRPQKPFTVEVKRVRKGAFAKQLGVETPKTEVPALKEASKPPLAAAGLQPDSGPTRRILEAIEPPPASPMDVVANATPRRPRGRPPKTVQNVPPKATKVVAGAKTRAARSEADVNAGPTPRRIVSPAEVSVVYLTPPLAPARENGASTGASLGASTGASAGVSHGGRAEAASNLPRGERWKRRLPKVLW